MPPPGMDWTEPTPWTGSVHSVRAGLIAVTANKIFLYIVGNVCSTNPGAEGSVRQLMVQLPNGDAHIDLSIQIFDTYTRSKVNVAPPLNPNLTPRDDRTQSLPYNGNGRSLLNYLWGKHCHYRQESMQLCGSLSKSII